MYFSGNVSSKLPNVGTTIFTVMSALAQQHKALNLAQGFPDFSCHPDLVKLVGQYMKQGHNQYAPMPGLMTLRERIAEKTENLYSARYNPEKEITVIPGATLGIYAAITAVVRENDEVIVIEPCYDSYIPAIELNGGKAVLAELKFPDYKPDWDKIKKLINFKTRMIIINSPHNPTGTILSAEDLSKLEKLVENSDIVVLSDEVYEHIIFDGLEHQSVARFPRLAERSFILSSFGKTYHTTGWKLGYCLAPENLMEQFRKVYQFMAFAANTPMQHAYAEFLSRHDEYLELGAFYQEKRDLFRKLLKPSRFKLLPCQGSYFQLLGYDKISDAGDLDIARQWTESFGVASIPVSVFYKRKNDNKVLRFCFAKSEETITKAAEILCTI